MDRVKKEVLRNACEYWELGVLETLYKRGILSEKEYLEITKIVKEDYENNNCV